MSVQVLDDADSIKKYYKEVFSNKRDRHVIFQKLLPTGPIHNILDYGCGMGGISDFLSNHYDANLDAIDICPSELKKATSVFSSNKRIKFSLVEDFSFPSNHYDLIYNCAVLEHVHNPGNFLARVNSMLAESGVFVIGLPNCGNCSQFINNLCMSDKRIFKISKNMSRNYKKARDHIHSWDPLHFVTLAASCGFEVEAVERCEGIPIFNGLKKIPLIGRYLMHIKYKVPLLGRLSYTMFFRLRKVKSVAIGNFD